MKIRIATRKSPLALAQTRFVATYLRTQDESIEVEEVALSTVGDEKLDEPLAKSGGKGLFVHEVEAALLDGRADLAVHSLKDVPNELAPGMCILAIPEREDARDVFVSAIESDVMALRAGSCIGTSSLRRACQLYAHRNDVAFRMLRGNVGTRLLKLKRAEYDGIILAYAGLKRLGLDEDLRREGLFVTPIASEWMLPAVGQAALAIEGADRPELRLVLKHFDHRITRTCVAAERAFLRAMGGNCTTPIAANARFEGPMFVMDGAVFGLDGKQAFRRSVMQPCRTPAHLSSEGATAIGTRLAEELLQAGAGALVAMSANEADPYRWLYSK